MDKIVHRGHYWRATLASREIERSIDKLNERKIERNAEKAKNCILPWNETRKSNKKVSQLIINCWERNVDWRDDADNVSFRRLKSS